MKKIVCFRTKSIDYGKICDTMFLLARRASHSNEMVSWIRLQVDMPVSLSSFLFLLEIKEGGCIWILLMEKLDPFILSI